MASLKYISYYLPEINLSNDDLCLSSSTFTPERIYEKVGILNRYRVIAGELASDMGIKAAEKLFVEYDFNKNDIDFLLFCTQTPDFAFPTTACIIQDKLGLKKSCGALDYNLGCSGYTYGLMLAKSLIDSSIAKNILLITAETYSIHLDKSDISNNSIFSDAAAACLISSESSSNILNFTFGTDGSGYQNLISKKKSFRENVLENSFYMNGAEVFKFTLFSIPTVVNEILEKNNLMFDDIDWFVFHQASKVVLEALKKKLKIPDEKFFNNLELVGNTVSSTIPIALKDGLDSNKISKGQLVLVIGFGVGYSWAGTIIKF